MVTAAILTVVAAAVVVVVVVAPVVVTVVVVVARVVVVGLVIAAVAAAAACALALPTLVGPSLDLSVFFSGSGVPATFRPDLTALGQAAAVITILAGVALIAGTARLRHRDVTGTLRMR